MKPDSIMKKASVSTKVVVLVCIDMLVIASVLLVILYLSMRSASLADVRSRMLAEEVENANRRGAGSEQSAHRIVVHDAFG